MDIIITSETPLLVAVEWVASDTAAIGSGERCEPRVCGIIVALYYMCIVFQAHIIVIPSSRIDIEAKIITMDT